MNHPGVCLRGFKSDWQQFQVCISPTALLQLRALEQAGMAAGLDSMSEPFQINVRSLGRLCQ